MEVLHMQINLDCLKDVLLFCVDNIDYEEVGDNTWTTNPVSLETLYTALATKKYSRKDIMRSVLKLKESHYISVLKFYPENKPYLDSCSIDDVTMRGYQFAETIRGATIWEKTKSVASRVGNHTLSFIEDVAHDVAVESAKQAITVMMTQNQQ